MAGELAFVDAIGVDGPYRTRTRVDITTLGGAKVGELSQVPALFVSRTFAALAAAPDFSLTDRVAMLAKAAEIYTGAVIDEQSPEDYVDAVTRTSGVPRETVEMSVAAVGRALAGLAETVTNGMPRGAVADWRERETLSGSGVWVRKGKTFAVLASGNTPGVHALWLESLALGYSVAVRPSSREPFTAYRLISALRSVGFDQHVALLPTDYAGADSMVEKADLSMVYGGQDVVDKYAHDSRVLPQGPGRSKMVVTSDVDWREYVDLIAESVSHLGGAACTCTTAVLVEDDPTGFARALADRLRLIGDSVLSVATVAQAEALRDYLGSVAEGTTAWLGADTVVQELESGGAALRPAVHEVADSAAPQLDIELPFPCVWVGPYDRSAGAAPLRNSLVLTALTRDESLVDALLTEPTIGNVYVGAHPTTWMRAGVPHDGYLSDHLMRTKAMIRSTSKEES